MLEKASKRSFAYIVTMDFRSGRVDRFHYTYNG